ncbi:MAG TPA: hypothetical protein VD789_10300 [Thermomicrobiales bacterium]|nr:hypothetical protein [Thermomicrobiales bacterium]
MQQLTGAFESIVSKARRLVNIDASPDKRRNDFSKEFGHVPPYREASAAEREQFARDVVRPVLVERAQAVQPAGDVGGSVSQATPGEASESFNRAYLVATDMGLAEKGRTYRDYLDQ